MQNRFSSWCFAAGLAGLLTLLLPISAGAQFSMIDDLSPQFEWRGRLEMDYRNQFKTNTDGGDSFEVWQVGLAGEFGGPINESILLGIRGGYQHTDYDFRLDKNSPPDYGSNRLPRDPWGGINSFQIVPSTTILVGSRFSVIAAVPINWAAETGSRRNGFAAGISSIVRWQILDNLRIGVGIGVTSQLEDDAETFPIVSLDWQIANAFQFQTEGSWLQGGNAVLLWGANRSIRLTISAGYERDRFRMDDNGSAVDRNGIGEVTSVPLDVGLRFRLYEGAYFDFRAGLAVAGKLRVENNNGRKLYDHSYDPAPRVSVALNLPFGLP
jgi:hypothetical protein